jgi:hypothetical protein
MVSWLRSFELNWKHLDSLFDPEDAIDLQLEFQGIRKATEPREVFYAWVKRAENMPGAILVPRGDPNRRGGATPGGRVVPTFKVAVIHHLKPFEQGDDGNTVVCLESFKVFANTVTVSVDELLSGLVSDIKASTKTVRERNLPSTASFRELKTEGVKKHLKAAPGEEVIKANALVNWPCGVYVPAPLLSMIFNEEEVPGIETQPSELDNPTEMLEKLLDGMGDLAHEDPGAFEAWKGSAIGVGLFLWTIANELNQGVAIAYAQGSKKELRFALKCNQEILFTEEEIKRRAISLFKDQTPDHLQEGSDPGRAYAVASGDSPVDSRASADKKRKPKPEGAHRTLADERQQYQDPIEEVNKRTKTTGLPPLPEPMREQGGGTGGPPWAVPPPPLVPQPRSNEDESFLILRDLIAGMANSNREFLAGMTRSNELIAESNRASTQALLAQGAALKELTLANKESMDSKEAKKKATSNWLPADVFLLKALSAEQGWRTPGLPGTTAFADSLFDKKNIIKATNLVREMGVKEQWSGGVLKSGLTEFIGGGFVAGDIDAGPVGFSVLYCFASSYTETDSNEFRKQQVKDAFGESKGLTDEMVSAFEKQHIFVPDDSNKAMEQLEVAIAFLKSICGRDTIAVDGYAVGCQILKTNKKKFDDWSKSDAQFLLKYLLFLDRMFYLFCKELQEFDSSPNPLLDAQPSLEGWMVRNVRKVILQHILNGVKPEFGLPRNFQGRTAAKDGLLDLKGATPTKNKARGGAPGGAAGGAGAAPAGAGGAARGGGDSGGGANVVPEWHKVMPAGGYFPEWQIPTGKRFGDFFGSHLTENNRIFPRYPHPKTKRPSSICARYQIELARGCRHGADCSLTHVRPQDIPASTRDKITLDIKALYATGGGPST